MDKLINNIKFWYNNSRPYSIPITFLSWLVIFTYSIIMANGNIINGIIAYIGIALVHLATNLSDDYFDFKRLSSNSDFLNSTKSIKCSYLKNGSATISDLRNVLIILFSIAATCGIFLMLRSGLGVILFMLAAFPIALFYSFLSSRGLGDFAVILAYGPLMFEGVYYVMTKNLSLDVLVLSMACAMFVNTILYAHMLMDYDEDVISNKTTLCTRLKSKESALKFLSVFYIAGYIFILILSVTSGNYIYISTFITIPLVIELFKYLKIYNNDKSDIPQIKFWHKPLDNWNDKKDAQTAPFFFRFMFTRNISTWFMLLTIFSIIISKIIKLC